MATTGLEQKVLSDFAARMMLLRPESFNERVSQELTSTVERIIRIRHDMEQQGLDGPRGAKVFVGCSIPVWEAMALHSGPLAPFAAHPEEHAKVLQLLSAAYPDAKDHRCFFQGIWLRGDGDAEPGHLYVPRDASITHGPQGQSLLDSCQSGGALSDAAMSYVKCLDRLAAPEFEFGLARKQATTIAALRDTCRVLEKVLQSLLLVSHSESIGGGTVSIGEAALARNRMPATVQTPSASPSVQSSSSSTDAVVFEVTTSSSLSKTTSSLPSAFTSSALRAVLTRVVMICYRTKETAEFPKGINTLLTSSELLKRPVLLVSTPGDVVAAQQQRTFADVLTPMVELWSGLVKREPRMGLTCEAPVPKDRDAAVKQWRGLVRTTSASSSSLQGYERQYSFGLGGNVVRNDDEADKDCDDETLTYTQRRVQALSEKISDDIPGEIRFDNKSSTLRDTDSLVKFLRDAVRMPQNSKERKHLMNHLLFDRSRKRVRSDDGTVSFVEPRQLEGRVLLPVVDSVDVAFGGGGSDKTVMTPQERIILNLS